MVCVSREGSAPSLPCQSLELMSQHLSQLLGMRPLSLGCTRVFAGLRGPPSPQGADTAQMHCTCTAVSALKTACSPGQGRLSRGLGRDI